METIDLKIVLQGCKSASTNSTNAAAALSVSPRGSTGRELLSNNNSCYRMQVPVGFTVGLLRDLVALSSGICTDLSDRLKLELHQVGDNNTNQVGRKKGASSNNKKKGLHKSSGAVLPLNDEAQLLSTLSVDSDLDAIFISNWNKVGSKQKFEIAGLLFDVLQNSSSVDGNVMDLEVLSCVYDAIMVHQENAVTSGSVSVGYAIAASDNLMNLLSIVGFDVELGTGAISVDAKALNKNRRVQLFLEFFREYHLNKSPLKSINYLNCFTPSSYTSKKSSSSTGGSGRQSSSTAASGVHHSAAVNIPRRNVQNHNSVSNCFSDRGVSRSLPIVIADDDTEDNKSYEPAFFASSPVSPAHSTHTQNSYVSSQRSRNAVRDVDSFIDLELENDLEAEMFDDFVLNSPLSGSPRTINRGRDRRRRRRERARVLLSQYQGMGYDIEDDNAVSFAAQQMRGGNSAVSMTYESLFELEDVPVGLDAKVMRLLPVQVLTEKDLAIMEKNNDGCANGDQVCRICLGDYSVGDSIMRLPCLHFYHSDCITKWLSSNKKCPQDMIPVDKSF